MPISHEKKIIFIHVVKTAGDSIEKALNIQKNNELYGFEDEDGIHYKNIGGMFLNSIKGIESKMKCLQHLTATQIRARYSDEVWNTYFKFAFVRNPWDLVVSQFSYIVQQRKDLHKAWEVDENTTFKDFVMRAKVGCRPELMFLCPQTDFLTDEKGKIIIDFVGRFENLNDDFLKVCKKVGIEAELKKTNVSKRGNYRDYYDYKTQKKVADIYKNDIELFGYKY